MAYLCQFVPDVLATVEFYGGPGMDELLRAARTLAGLYAAKSRKVPDGAPGGFMPARWHTELGEQLATRAGRPLAGV
jgi:hypothetical protein